MKPIPAAIASTDDVHPVVFVEPKFAERFRQCVTAAGFELILDSGLCDVCDLTAFRFGPSTDVEKIAHWFNEIAELRASAQSLRLTVGSPSWRPVKLPSRQARSGALTKIRRVAILATGHATSALGHY